MKNILYWLSWRKHRKTYVRTFVMEAVTYAKLSNVRCDSILDSLDTKNYILGELSNTKSFIEVIHRLMDINNKIIKEGERIIKLSLFGPITFKDYMIFNRLLLESESINISDEIV